MFYSKLLSLLLLLVSCISQAEPLSWVAEKEGLSYTLVGSVHVGDDSMYPMPSYLTERLSIADALIVEANTLQHEALRIPQHGPPFKIRLMKSSSSDWGVSLA
ncbi:hypothetical protein JCM19233_3665 [Vibrio astriarenae]|nr:hypothetical protein JCM19233_3665 [Vibrio sp. C7]